MKCESCGTNLTEEMMLTGFCYECGEQVYIQSKEEIEKAKIQEEKLQEWKKRLEYKKLAKDFLMTTGYNFEGHEILKYNKVICSETVIATGISDVLGVQNEKLTLRLDEARNESTNKLIYQTISIGANAIIGIDFDYVAFNQYITCVIANGTAVTVQKILRDLE